MIGLTLKLKKAALISAAVSSTALILIFSCEIRQGVQLGLSLCVTSVIPSLFLFTAAAIFIVNSGAGQILGRILSPVIRPLLGLTAEQGSVFLMSCVAGYPVGAKLLDTLYCNGKISRTVALKMLTFGVNAGPAFIISTIGEGFLKSRNDGIRLLICHLLATVIIASVVRFLPDRLFSDNKVSIIKTAPEKERSAISDIFVLSVANAGKTMLSVTVFIVFFAGVGSMLSSLSLYGSETIISLLEVTAGLSKTTRSQLPFAAFLLGFGGISVIFQVISSAENLKPKFALVLFSRLVHGVISVALIKATEVLFPRNLPAGAFNLQPSSADLNTHPVATLSLILLCTVMLWFLNNTGMQNSRTLNYNKKAT